MPGVINGGIKVNGVCGQEGDTAVPDGWKLLTDGGDRVAVAIDFEAVGRPEAAFSDLAPMLDPPLRTWAAVQPPAGTEVSGPAYLEHWAGGLRAAGHEIDAVLGFCTGGVFAAALAERIGGWQRLPTVVLLDPEPATARVLVGQLVNAVRTLATVAPDAQLTWALEAAAGLLGVADLTAVGDTLGSLYQEAAAPVFARLGLRPDYQARLVEAFKSLMSYLAAGADVVPGRGWAAATAIVSAGGFCDPEGTARRIPAAVGHAGLLRSPDVARLVSGLLG